MRRVKKSERRHSSDDPTTPSPPVGGRNPVQALRKFVVVADWINEWIVRGAAWLMLLMVLITFAVVLLRYVFCLGWIWMQESFVWLLGAVFMLGAGYSLLHNAPFPVDIFCRGASHRTK